MKFKMSLIKCPECEKQISDTIKECPNCGFVLKNKKQNVKNKRKIITIVYFIFLGIMFFLLFKITILNKVEIPSLYKKSEDTAVTILENKGLITNVEYRYNDDVNEGYVISTYPNADKKVNKNSIVKIYVSKGPKTIVSEQTTYSWYYISNNSDDWSCDKPYIDNTTGNLYIDCNPTFGASFTWESFGNASINDTFDKKVPISIIYDNEDVVKGEEQSITLKIPINDLEVKKPTDLYLELFIKRNGSQQAIFISFAISW
jgi:hypothetical protein